MKYYIKTFYVILTLNILNASNLFLETFSGSGNSADNDGWTFTGNWNVGSQGYLQHQIGNPPPGAYFYYTPRERDYEYAMVSPEINVAGETEVLVQFYFELDYYAASQGQYNGLRVEYFSGGDIDTVLQYEINYEAGDVDLSGRKESFNAIVDGNLILRWVAYGSDSWYINSWDVDSITVLTLPKINSINMISLGEDSERANAGTEVQLSFLTNSSFPNGPIISVNGNNCDSVFYQNNLWNAIYIVSEDDPDGPLQFTIDFTDENGISGETVFETSAESNVIVDNSDPPSFSVGGSYTTGGNEDFNKIWSEASENINLVVNVPQDSAVINYSTEDGRSLFFNGSSDYIEIPVIASYMFESEFTVEVWVKPYSYDETYEGIFNIALDNGTGQQAGFGFVYFATGWRFFLKTIANTINYIDMAEMSTPVGQWTHMSATYDGSQVVVYRNGLALDSTDATGNIEWIGAPSNFTIGKFTKNGNSKYFHGKIDEIRLWNTSRTAAEIKGSRNLNLNSDEYGLVGYWQVDEGQSFTIMDSTSNNNSGTIHGPQWENDSPINFKEPIYDTGVIVGSEFQLRARINDYAFESFGERNIIEQQDFDNGTMIISAPKLAFESIGNFEHEGVAEISASLFDVSGNYSEGTVSTDQIVIDIITNQPINMTINSDNAYPEIAKTGNSITILTTFNEDVEPPSLFLEENSMNITTLIENREYSATYTLNGSEPEGELEFTITATDYLGNQDEYSHTTDNSSVHYDKTLPFLNSVNIISNNPRNSAWAKLGDLITISFQANEGISDPIVEIQSQVSNVTALGSNRFRAEYASSIDDNEGIAQFEILFYDIAGNEGETVTSTTDNSFIIYDITPPSNFLVDSVNTTGGNIVASYWNSTNTGMNINIPIDNDTTLDNGQVQAYMRIGNYNFEPIGNISTIGVSELGESKTISVNGSAIRSLPGYSDDGIITARAIIYDIPGNEKIGIQSEDSYIINETPPILNYVSYRSNFSDTTRATSGNEITLKIETNKEIQTPNGTILGQSTQVTGLGNNIWQLSYIAQSDDNEGVVTFQLNNLYDISGNPGSGTTSTTNNSNVILDNTAAILNPVRVNSSNVDSNFAKAGDTISITYVSDDYLINHNVTISDRITLIEDLGIKKYVARYVFQDEDYDMEGEVLFDILVTDTLGMIGDTVRETTNLSFVIFDMTAPQLDSVFIFSTNSNNASIAITGNEVKLKFIPSEPILSSSIIVKIAGENAEISELDDGYIGTLLLSGDEQGGILPFTIDFIDRASNPGIQVSSTTDNSYVNHDIIPPELTNVSIYSNNQDSSWAKAGDTVFVEFIGNEELDSIYITIGGEDSTSYYNDGGARYRGYHIMDENDSTGALLSFNIDYRDLGGVEGPTVHTTSNNSYVKYDSVKPTLSNLSFTSSNMISDSAAIEDTVFLLFDSSEPCRSIQLMISDDEINPEQSNLSLYGYRVMQGIDSDGPIYFSILLEDSAGNYSEEITNIDTFPQIYFDGTLPTMVTVSFLSSNRNDSSLAIIGDTLVLNFDTSEPLSTLIVKIAGQIADTTFEISGRMPYRSWRILDGSETEGYIPFQIDLTDNVGNEGVSINSTTDNSSVLFDTTPPSEYMLGTVLSSGGPVKEGFWNTYNDTLIITIPLENTDTSLIGGYVQPLVKFSNQDFTELGSKIEIYDLSQDGSLVMKVSGDSFETTLGFSENTNAYFSSKIKDKAGNETIGAPSTSLIHIDQIAPVLDSLNLLSSNQLSSRWVKISDVIQLSFRSSEGLDSVIIDISDNNILPNISEGGIIFRASHEINQEDPDGLLSLEISYFDSAFNQGIIVTELDNHNQIFIDKTRPLVNEIFEGSSLEDLNYYNNADSLILHWNHQDSLSGIHTAYIGIGTNTDSANIRYWTPAGLDTFGSWNGLALQNDSTYYGATFVMDSAGNYSDTIWGDGITIDIENPETGYIEDGKWIIEMDYTIDSTSLSYTWDGFSDNIGIEFYEISIATNNDTTNILNWSKIGNQPDGTITGLDLDRDTLYFTYMRAVDSAKNFSNAAKTDGIYFDDSEPKVTSITPDFNDSLKTLSISNSDSIRIKFNRLLYFYDLRVFLNTDTNFVTQKLYSDSVITITWDTTLASNDTVTVYLDSILAYNALFVSDTLHFYSDLWGDLNNDYDISIEDILVFNRSWPQVDIGPYVNKLPHIRPMLDGKANLIDLRSFAKIWQWRYFSLEFDTLNNLERPNNINVSGIGEQLIFYLPEKVAMADIIIGKSNTDIKKMYTEKFDNSTFSFRAIDTTNQIVKLSLANENGLGSKIRINVGKTLLGRFTGKIQHKFLDIYGNQLSSGVIEVQIDQIPEIFEVSESYPNPFNPRTSIQYSLPDMRNVTINIIDIQGRTIISTTFKNHLPGRFSYTWDGTNNYGKEVSTGIYFFQIKAGSDLSSRKMLLLK